MSEILNIIQQLTKRYSADIITEARFINMFNDFYPSRKNPSISPILKSIVNDGYSAALLITDKRELQSFVSKTASSLEKQYGYEKKLAEDLLYYLAIGTDVISLNEYQSLIKSKASSQPKHNCTKPEEPSKNTISSNTNNSVIKKLFIQNHLLDLLILSLWLFILAITPFAYASLTQEAWPFPSVLAVGFVNLMFYIGPSERFQGEKPDLLFRGAQMAIYMCSAIFFFIGPFVCCTKIASSLFYHYGINPGKETPTIFTAFLSFVFTILLMSTFVGVDMHIANNKKRTDRWMKGFFYMLCPILFIGISFVTYPLIRSYIYKQKIINKNKTTLSLQEKRKNKTVSLAFKDFSLGGDIRQYTDTLLHKDYNITANDSNISNLSEIDSLMYDLSLNSKNYLPMMHSVATIETEWDNTYVTVYLYSINSSISAIKIRTGHPVDSIVNMYISKYGEAETSIINYSDMSLLSLPIIYIMSFEENVLPIDYSWTFSNAEIHITNEGFSSHDCDVIYIEKKCISMLEDKEKRDEQMRKELERIEKENKRKQKEEIEIELEKERKRINNNHKKSLDQI